MKRKFKLIILIFAIVLVVIQFIRPLKNTGIRDNNHLYNQVAVPEEIQKTFQNACADCHSNNTRYPWYNQIAPVSWMISNHVREGKKHLNISEWGKASKIDQVTFLDNICTEIKEGRMPVKSYTLIHKDARLTKNQVDEICAWADKLAGSLADSK
jgi:hypothetical protein